MQLPDRLPENGELAAVYAWLNELREYVASLAPAPAPGSFLSWTTRGVMRRPLVEAGATAENSSFQWKGEWNAAQTYEKGDMVIRGSNNVSSAARNNAPSIYGNGRQAGLYIAALAVPAGVEPVEPNSLAPTNGGVTYWETFGRGAFDLLVIRAGPTGGQIRLDSSNPNGGVNIALVDCNGKNLSIREVNVCVGGATRKMMILGSAPYS